MTTERGATSRYQRGAWLRLRFFVSDVLTVAAMFIPPFKAAYKRWHEVREISRRIAKDYP